MARETRYRQLTRCFQSTSPRKSGSSRRFSLERLEERRLLSIEPHLLADVNVGENFSDPDDFVEVGELVFFTADDGIHGRELWVSDASPAGTQLVLDIFPGSSSSEPTDLTRVGDILFFAARDEAENYELWRSNGTSAGTVQVLDLLPGSEGSHPANLIYHDGLLVFTADDGSSGEQFWTTNGTAIDTVRFTSQAFTGSIEHVTSVDGVLYFSAADAESGRELWKSHGTDATTARIMDIHPGVNDSSPSDFIEVGGGLFFTADDGTHGSELWKSNGTALGTVLVKDIQPGVNGSLLHDPIEVEGTLFFSASDGTHGDELWTSNGSSAGTVLVVDLNPGLPDAQPMWTTNVDGSLFFSATNDSAVEPQLWKSDGTAEGTAQLNTVTPYFITEMHSAAFFGGSGGLWMSDGTVEGTFIVQPPAGQQIRHLRNLTNLSGRLFFGANDLVIGREPWILATQPPVAIADVYTMEHHQELIVTAVDGVLSNDRGDPISYGVSPLEALLVDEPDHGTLTFASDGSFHYVPDWIFSGTDSFTYYVDTGLFRSETVTVEIEVQFVDHLDFHSPKDGILYVSAVGGSSTLTTTSELGFGSSTVPHRPRLVGLPTTSSEIFAGYVRAGELIPLSILTALENLTSYASSSINTGTAIEAFSDRNDSLGWNHLVYEQTSPDTWVLHLDDAFPLSDYDDELLVQFRIADALMPTDLGILGQATSTGIDLSGGEVWFGLETANEGTLTLETFFAGAPDDVNLTLTNPRGFELATSTTVAGGERLDWHVFAGETYYIKMTGTNTNVDLRATNLVDVSVWNVTVNGTDADDVFALDATFATPMQINGVEYPISPGEYWTVTFDGGLGNDRATLLGTPADETVVVQTGSATLTSGRMTFNVLDVAEVDLISGGGSDSAKVYDSPDDDVVSLMPDVSEISGGGFQATLDAFESVEVFSSGLGLDMASFYDSPGDDTFLGQPTVCTLEGTGFFLLVEGFDYVHAYALAGGVDTATLYDSGGDDQFVAKPTYAKMYGDGFVVRAKHFEQVEGFTSGLGNDIARLYDSPGDDTFFATPTEASMRGANFDNRAISFERVFGYANEGGVDVAQLYDSPENDIFTAYPNDATLSGPGYSNRVFNFDYVHAYSKAGGYDVASLYDSTGDDTFIATQTYGKLYGPGYMNRAKLFDEVHAYAKAGGYDGARLMDSAGTDYFESTPVYSRLTGSNYNNRAKFFEYVRVTGSNGGNDIASIRDSSGDDLLEAFGTNVLLTTNPATIMVQYFSNVMVKSMLGGTDTQDIDVVNFLLQTAGPWIDI